MTTAAAPHRRPFGRLGETLAMIRFSHTLFALPFALTGMVLAARGLPRLSVVGWILVAMAGARTAAMTFNRLVDRHIDAANPRTADRALPAGRLSPRFAWLVFGAACLALLLAAWRLNPLALGLAPLALLIICAYSLTKRLTAWSHLVLGLALAGAPLGAWIAVRGDLALPPLLLGAAVLFWTAGFDVIYALQDVDADRAAGLHSLPAWLGPAVALRWARIFHAVAVGFLLALGARAALGAVYHAGVLLAAALLVYEHLVVGPADLSRLQLAFFRINVAIGIILLAFTSIDVGLA